MAPDVVIRRAFWATAPANLAVAVLMLFPASLPGLIVGLPEPPPHVLYRALLALFIGMFGVTYVWLALQTRIASVSPRHPWLWRCGCRSVFRTVSQDEFRDEFGFVGPLPLSSNQRRVPEEGFPTGPEIGERLPDFSLVDHTGRTVDLHADRGDAKAAVVFFRSAVW